MTTEQKPESKKQKQADEGEKKGPEHVIRDGGIAALVWKRQSATGFPYYEYSLSRSWKSPSSGKAGYSQNFFAKNQAQLLKVVELASQWITEAEAKDQAAQSEALAA